MTMPRVLTTCILMARKRGRGVVLRFERWTTVEGVEQEKAEA